MADLDGDGWPELASGGSGSKLTVFAVRGTGVLGAAGELLKLGANLNWESPDTSLVVVDWDRDGKLDLLLGTRSGKVWFLRNTGTGVRAEFGRYRALALQSGGHDLKVESFAAPCVGDWDGDGAPDLVVGDRAGGVTLFRKDRSGGVLDVGAGEVLVERGADPAQGPQEYAHPALADWNGDGRVDLLVGDHWLEARPKLELTPAQSIELDALQEERRLHEDALYNARSRIGKQVCRGMGIDGGDLWKADAATRTRYQREVERATREDQELSNALAAMTHLYRREKELTPPARTHGRVWVYLREPR